MSIIYIATLGQRPEAITVAFDRLHEQYRYAALAILHTEPTVSGIADALADLKAVLMCDYADIPVSFHELTYADGTPLLDISDQASAEAYHRAVLQQLYAYRRAGWQQHLMVAGGRKAMSIYAMLAASALFEPPHDRVWTVLSPEKMLTTSGQFHIPAGLRQSVQLVDLPLRPARVAPGTAIETLLRPPPDRAAAFLAKLTPAERKLTDALRDNPYASNEALAAILQKSIKTIETQFRSIYNKLVGFLEFGEALSDKRQALLDILRGE